MISLAVPSSVIPDTSKDSTNVDGQLMALDRLIYVREDLQWIRTTSTGVNSMVPTWIAKMANILSIAN